MLDKATLVNWKISPWYAPWSIYCKQFSMLFSAVKSDWKCSPIPLCHSLDREESVKLYKIWTDFWSRTYFAFDHFSFFLYKSQRWITLEKMYIIYFPSIALGNIVNWFLSITCLSMLDWTWWKEKPESQRTRNNNKEFIKIINHPLLIINLQIIINKIFRIISLFRDI